MAGNNCTYKISKIFKCNLHSKLFVAILSESPGPDKSGANKLSTKHESNILYTKIKKIYTKIKKFCTKNKLFNNKQIFFKQQKQF